MTLTDQMRQLAVGECFAKLHRTPVCDFDATAVQTHCRNVSSALSVLAKRLAERTYVVERIDTLNHNKDCVVYGIVVTRTA